jgi:uncharacterized membrane protein
MTKSCNNEDNVILMCQRGYTKLTSEEKGWWKRSAGNLCPEFVEVYLGNP